MKRIRRLSSESSYMSSSEKYLVVIACTNVKIVDLRDDSCQIIKLKDVKFVCMTTDDQYLFLSKYESSMLYCYNLKSNKIIGKHLLKRNTEIEFIFQIYEKKLIIGIKNKKDYIYYKQSYKHAHHLIIFDYEKNITKLYDLPAYISFNGKPLLFNNEVYLKCEHKNHKIKLYKFSDGDFVLIPFNKLGFKLSMHTYIKISNSLKYISIDDTNSSYIQVINIDNHKCVLESSKKDIPKNYEDLCNLNRGNFGTNLSNEDMYYLVHGRRIDVYNLCTFEKRSIELDFLPIDIKISFKTNTLIVHTYENPIRCYCDIYKL